MSSSRIHLNLWKCYSLCECLNQGPRGENPRITQYSFLVLPASQLSSPFVSPCPQCIVSLGLADSGCHGAFTHYDKGYTNLDSTRRHSMCQLDFSHAPTHLLTGLPIPVSRLTLFKLLGDCLATFEFKTRIYLTKNKTLHTR